jgi:hypothetical protein
MWVVQTYSLTVTTSHWTLALQLSQNFPFLCLWLWSHFSRLLNSSAKPETSWEKKLEKVGGVNDQSYSHGTTPTGPAGSVIALQAWLARHASLGRNGKAAFSKAPARPNFLEKNPLSIKHIWVTPKCTVTLSFLLLNKLFKDQDVLGRYRALEY